MSKRLDQQRQALLEPKRMRLCKEKLESLGFDVVERGSTQLQFIYNGGVVNFWPYSGWHSGRGIQDGRGFEKLLKQVSHE